MSVAMSLLSGVRRRPAGFFRIAAKRVLSGLASTAETMRPAILISSTRRSGSTLLMEMMSTQHRTTYVNQPLDRWGYHPHRDRLPGLREDRFLGLDETSVAEVTEYIREIASYSIRYDSQWRVLAPAYTWCVDRVVIKELNAKALLPQIARLEEVQVIYLIRRPVATALSILKRGWGSAPLKYLDNDWFREEILGEERIRACESAHRSFDRLERSILEWGLSNYIPLTTGGGWLTLSYEELISRFGRISSLLGENLDLDNPAAMVTRGESPSRTSLDHSRQEVRRRGPFSRINAWRREVSPERIHRVMSFMNATLDLRPYKADSGLPNPDYCLLGALEEDYSALDAGGEAFTVPGRERRPRSLGGEEM